jgi:carboxyl-terminal processing protease
MLLFGLAACAGGAAFDHSLEHRLDRELPFIAPSPLAESREASPEQPSERFDVTADDQCSVRALRLPSGGPAALSCRDARRIVAQVRARMASAEVKPDPLDFAHALRGWLDPHGLWSAPPDAPAAHVLEQQAGALLDELTRVPADESDCDAAREIGGSLRGWVERLRGVFDSVATRSQALSPSRAFDLASADVFEDDPVMRPGEQLARDLGQRVAVFERTFSGSGVASARAAAERLLPDLPVAAWTRVVLAAAVRAYVPAVDAHGQWAPLDEEWSLYSADAAVDPAPRLWRRMARSALGVRVLEADLPLRAGDLVLAIGGVRTAGLSIEQLEQLAQLESVGGEPSRVVELLRRGAREPATITVPLPDIGESRSESDVLAERVAFGGGRVLVLTVPDVPDGLGEELSRRIADAVSDQSAAGVLLDLRGNGGGSTDGAKSAIGVFLPGVPSFPILRRGGVVEVERALVPDPRAQWRGPVAVLVDGYTASAAEMIAGAISSYGRGVVIGTRTFGKGCIQEYFDDRSGNGVLRLTTMLFALPDGTPLQGTGLLPNLRLPMPAPREREALLIGAPPSWRGPDVRVGSTTGGPVWPSHYGRVGVCRDKTVCAALRRLGAAQPVPALESARAPRAKRRDRDG